MIDVGKTIEPKSDQLNADDLIVGPKTLKITSVKEKSAEQPIAIHYEGDNGKPYLPCKSMRRVMVHCWGRNGDKYVGRHITVYNDTSVTWGGSEVGGIRISHMSDIDNDVKLMITVSRGRKKPYEIKKLVTEPENVLTDADYETLKAEFDMCETMAQLQACGAKIKEGNYDASGKAKLTQAYRDASAKLRAE
jgi:hypothetical protein